MTVRCGDDEAATPSVIDAHRLAYGPATEDGSVRRLDWLGIGAQRAGTTWFTSLLTQHPRVGLAVADQKELHRLYTRPLRSWGPVATEKLLGLVDAPDELLIGECTP